MKSDGVRKYRENVLTEVLTLFDIQKTLVSGHHLTCYRIGTVDKAFLLKPKQKKKLHFMSRMHLRNNSQRRKANDMIYAFDTLGYKLVFF